MNDVIGGKGGHVIIFFTYPVLLCASDHYVFISSVNPFVGSHSDNRQICDRSARRDNRSLLVVLPLVKVYGLRYETHDQS